MLAPHRDHQARELEQREPGVEPGAPVDGDGHHAALGEPERGARVAALGDVGVELVRRGAEALRVGRGVVRHLAAGDEQRAGLEHVAAGGGVQLVAAGDPRGAALHVHARAHGVPGRREGDVVADHAVRAHLPERQPVGAPEEPAHERLAYVVAGAPRLEALLPRRHDRDADLRAAGVVTRDMERGGGASLQQEATAAAAPVRRSDPPDGEVQSGHTGSVARRPRIPVKGLLPGKNHRVIDLGECQQRH